MRPNVKVAIVTGAGIGKAVTLTLLTRAYYVAVAGLMDRP